MSSHKSKKDPFSQLAQAMPEEEQDNHEDWVSKTQVKQEMHELTAMGKTIVEMSPSDTKKIPLDNELLTAIESARTMRMGALKRQIQYIGKLLRKRDSEDTNKIAQAVDNILTAKSSAGRSFKQLEKWRERLLDEGNDALTEFCEQHPKTDVQRLRQLIRHAQKERSQEKPPKYFRQLFQEIKIISENNN